MNSITEKKCKRCGESAKFRPGRNICKKCEYERTKRLRLENPEKARIYNKNWREANPEYFKQWYNANLEKTRAYARDWQRANREKTRKASDRWKKENPEKTREYAKRWAAENSERKKLTAKRWYDADPEKRRENTRKWREANPERARDWKKLNREKVRAISHTYRARRAGNGGKYTPKEWKDLCDYYGNKCLCCERTDVKLTVDHVIPIKLGGVNTIDNIQPLCQPCNSKKHTHIVDYRPFR